MGRFGMVITVTLTVLVSYGIIVYIKLEEDKICDELVMMNDGSQIEATEVNTYDNGMSYIQQCNGEDVEIPTINIKMVKHIEKTE